MNMLAQINSSVKTMSSKDLLDLINQVRCDMGEPLIRLNSFNIKIEDELEGEYYTKNVVENTNATVSYIYDLTIDQCILIGMRESKAVRKNVLSILNRKQRVRCRINLTKTEHFDIKIYKMGVLLIDRP